MQGRVFWAALFLAAVLSGCTSSAAEVCARLAECDLFPEGYGEDKCEAQADQRVSSERLDQCAECVTDTPCREIVETCRADCEPIYE